MKIKFWAVAVSRICARLHLHLALCALLGGGCARYVARPLDPERSALALVGRGLAAKTWTLSALTAEALVRSPQLALARRQYQTAQAGLRTAGERPNPTLALSPQIVTPYTSWMAGTYGVDFDWTFETAGKRSRRLEVAHAAVRAAAANVVTATWAVRVAVRQAFLEIYAAEQRGQLLGEAIAQQRELLKTVDERIAAGAEARSVSSQPRLLQAQLRLQEADARKNAALARAALAEALGMGTSGLLGVNFSFAEFREVPRPRGAPQRAALTHRADVLAALAEYAATEGTLRLEIARQYPDLHLNPGYALDQNENKWTLGLWLTLPILQQNQGAIGEAEAKRAEAEARFEAVQAKVLADCDRAAAAVGGARAKLATTEELLAEQSRQVESEQRLVAAGEGEKLALLGAQVERATTLTARLDALVELQAALGRIEEATQCPLAK